MLAHNGILFLKKTAARLRTTERPVVRMTASQRWQHFILAASFIVLAVTGFALKFPGFVAGESVWVPANRSAAGRIASRAS